MEHIAPILRVIISPSPIASLGWIIFAFTALFMLKSEIVLLLRRLTKLQYGKARLEFEKEQLISFADASIEAVPLLRPVIQTRMASADQEQKIDATIESILQQAKSAPKVALMTLRVELKSKRSRPLRRRECFGAGRLFPYDKP